jgi:hypothetical protein
LPAPLHTTLHREHSLPCHRTYTQAHKMCTRKRREERRREEMRGE